MEGMNDIITPEIREKIDRAAKRINEDFMPAFSAAFSALAAAARDLVEAFTAAMAQINDRAAILRVAVEIRYPNKRVLHLAKHAKNERVRKKNINRIRKWLEKEGF